MTSFEILERIEKSEESAKYFEGKADALERQYPGVRPSWVSGDIGTDMAIAQKHRAEAKRLRGLLGEVAA